MTAGPLGAGKHDLNLSLTHRCALVLDGAANTLPVWLLVSYIMCRQTRPKKTLLGV